VSSPADFVPIAVTSRSGHDESVHFGALVVLGPDGAVVEAMGNPDVAIFPRSANKPMQAVAMLRRGLDLPLRLVALVCASHDGLPMHRDGVREILASAGLDESALGNVPDYPLDADEARQVVRDGGGTNRVQMTCSGKHSGMVATCVRNGWAHDGYLDLDHPLQLHINDVIDEFTGTSCAVGVDRCGAPAHVMTLTQLARSYRAIATGAAGPEGARVHEAMTSFPEMVAGPANDVTRFMRRVPGMLVKDGAEGVYAVALPDGRAVALKISDGSARARPAVVISALARVGLDLSDLTPSVSEPILGRGAPVGSIRSLVP